MTKILLKSILLLVPVLSLAWAMTVKWQARLWASDLETGPQEALQEWHNQEQDHEQGREQGKEHGQEQGKEQGQEQGREQGRVQGQEQGKEYRERQEHISRVETLPKMRTNHS